MDKIAFFILNVFLNSLLAFFTVVLLIECVIFLFRIPQGRVAAVLRMIPIIKLPLDLFLYDFSRWSYAQGINPLNCEEGTRMLSVMCGCRNFITDWLFLPVNTSIQLTIPGDLTFTVADVVGHSFDSDTLKVFALLFICFTVAFMIRRIVHYYHSLKLLDFLTQSSEPLDRKMRNKNLFSSIRKYGVQIFSSQILDGSPFVAGLITSKVFIPVDLSKNLSRNEYEAVLAHEMEHVRYKDSLVRLFLDFIGNIFWWVPTKWLRKRIEEGQEVGCDRKCKGYGIDQAVLASALSKSAKYAKQNPNNLFAHHLTKHATLKRINLLMQPTSNRYIKARFTLTCLAIGIAFIGVLLGRFWMF